MLTPQAVRCGQSASEVASVDRRLHLFATRKPGVENLLSDPALAVVTGHEGFARRLMPSGIDQPALPAEPLAAIWDTRE